MSRPLRIGLYIVLLACITWLHPGPAHAGIEDWQVNEVVTHAGTTQIRYVELRNDVGGCMFANTRVVIYDAQGVMQAATTLVPTTTCFGPDSYFITTTPLAAVELGVSADHQGLPELPVDSGQVCFSSTSTRYDCTRWGMIDVPVTDLFGSQDITSAPAPGPGQALVRTDTTHVVMDDWTIDGLTPRAPNDGSPVDLPDAGPTPPDAGPIPDAPSGDPDSGPAPGADAAPVDPDAQPDARNTRYLDLDPSGGAACGCQTHPGPRGHAGSLALLALALALLLRRRRCEEPRNSHAATRNHQPSEFSTGGSRWWRERVRHLYRVPRQRPHASVAR